jgi:DNA-nicking Smr family endonuclease
VKKPSKNQTGQTGPDDVALFRAAVGAVKPLADQNRITPQPAPRKPLLRPAAPPPAIPDTLSDGCPAKSLTDFAGESVPEEYLSKGLPHMTLRKLRRGIWPIEDSLDLHGNHTDAARKLLQEFLQEAVGRNLRCVLVIHGKGLNSRGGEAVLRKLARHWLAQHPHVLGYCEAPAKYGGSGAVLVLLKAGS